MKIHLIISAIGDVYNKYSKGPNTDPWGTPCAKQRCADWQSSICTNCLRDLRYESNQARALPFIPKRWESLDKSIEWSTVSKAEDKSSRRSITDLLSSTARSMSFCTFSKAVSVESGAHYPERATSIQCLWNGVFTSRFIFRSALPGISLRFFRSDLFISFGFS